MWARFYRARSAEGDVLSPPSLDHSLRFCRGHCVELLPLPAGAAPPYGNAQVRPDWVQIADPRVTAI